LRALVGQGVRVGLLADAPWEGRDHQGASVPFAHLPREPEEAARTLYAAMRALDDAGCAVILTENVAADGLGEAVADRLKKASAPRP